MLGFRLFMAHLILYSRLGKRKTSEKLTRSSPGTNRQVAAEIRLVHALSELDNIGFRKTSSRLRCSRETAPSVKFLYIQPGACGSRESPALSKRTLWSQRGQIPRRRSDKASRKTSTPIKAGDPSQNFSPTEAGSRLCSRFLRHPARELPKGVQSRHRVTYLSNRTPFTIGWCFPPTLRGVDKRCREAAQNI